jgi:hypothetical protein
MTVVIEPKLVQEIEVPADATLLGLNTSGTGVVLLVGVPQGAGPVRRKAWVVPAGSDITVEAQNGEFLGTVVLLSGEQPVVVVVFVETQKQAIERATHRSGFRAPPV